MHKDLFILDNKIYSGNYEQLKEYFSFDEKIGYYVPIQAIKSESFIPGNGGFPYSFARNYEAIYNFDIFKNVQVITETKEYWASKYLKTFHLVLSLKLVVVIYHKWNALRTVSFH